jgi:hypothetical protein
MLGTVVALGFRLAAMRLARSFLALAAQTAAQVLGLVMPVVAAAALANRDVLSHGTEIRSLIEPPAGCGVDRERIARRRWVQGCHLAHALELTVVDL